MDQKKALEAKKKLDAELFKTVQTQQKVPFGTGEYLTHASGGCS